MSTYSVDFTTYSGVENPIASDWETAYNDGVEIRLNGANYNAATDAAYGYDSSRIKPSVNVGLSKQYAEVTIGANWPASYGLGPACFVNGDNAYYIQLYSPAGYLNNRIYKIVNGSRTNLSNAAGTTTISEGDKVGLLADYNSGTGITTLTVYLNPTTYDVDGYPTDGTKTSTTDSALAGGQVGLFSSCDSTSNEAFASAFYAAGLGPGRSITSIDSPLVFGSTGNNVSVTGFNNDGTGLTIKDDVGGTYSLAMTSFSGTGDGPYSFTVPDFTSVTVDTSWIPFPDAYWGHTAVFTDGVDTSEIAATLELPSGYSLYSVGATVDTTEGSFCYGWTGTPQENDQVVYPTANNTSIVDDKIVTDQTSGTISMWYFDQTDGMLKPFDFQLGNSSIRITSGKLNTMRRRNSYLA